MKKICLFLLLLLPVQNGCAESSALIKAGSNTMRHDVFQELSDGGAVPQGFADLRIVSTLKTHKPGIYPFEKKSHGTPEYRMLVNIDGQAILLQGELQLEDTDLNAFRDPEAGEGIRYRFSKNLRLNAGTHKITIALPDDEIAIEREITLPERSKNSLVVQPVYGSSPGKQRPGFYGVTSFKEGLKGLRPTLNGQGL